MTLVAAVDHRFDDLDIERAVLVPVGADVRDTRGFGREETLDLCRGADAILVGARFRFGADEIGRLAGCRAIVRYGIGYDNVDVAAASAAGIQVAYVPDYCIEEVADHAVAMLLALNRRLFELDRLVRDGRWGIPSSLQVRRLSSCTLGIVGFGRIGEAVGARAVALGLDVVAFDPLRPEQDIVAAGAEPVTLDALLERSDYVTLHAPPADDRPLLGRRELRRMKPGAMLVNVGRAGLVDEPEVSRALRDGRLAGAALDVVAQEPLVPPNPLLEVPNLIVTPHAAWYSQEAVVELRQKAAEEAARALQGDPLRHPARAPQPAGG